MIGFGIAADITVESPSKQERYFSGMPLQQDPRKPLPGEVPPDMRANFLRAALAIGLFSLGLILGLAMGADTPEETREQITDLQTDLERARERIRELDRTLAYARTSNAPPGGALSAKDRRRHEREGQRYAAALRRAKAQPAAELIEWFVRRWNDLLDQPLPDDRTGRRAQVLTQLIGGMARNIDPEDYVPWQAELLSGDWLGELHIDLDGDGLPAKRHRTNPKDGFVDTSVCEIAMALNQAVTDAQLLVQPTMRCDSPKAKTSVFLQGATIDDALTELTRALKKEGFFIRDRVFEGTRMILIGPGQRRL